MRATQTAHREEAITLKDVLQGRPQLNRVMDSDPEFMVIIKQGYAEDALFRKVVTNPSVYPNFTLHNGLLYV